MSRSSCPIPQQTSRRTQRATTDVRNRGPVSVTALTWHHRRDMCVLHWTVIPPQHSPARPSTISRQPTAATMNGCFCRVCVSRQASKGQVCSGKAHCHQHANGTLKRHGLATNEKGGWTTQQARGGVLVIPDRTCRGAWVVFLCDDPLVGTQLHDTPASSHSGTTGPAKPRSLYVCAVAPSALSFRR